MDLVLTTATRAPLIVLGVFGSTSVGGTLPFDDVRSSASRTGQAVFRALCEATSGAERAFGTAPRILAPWLTQCEKELEELDDEAAEEGIEPPTAVAKASAKALLGSLARMDLPEPLISATEWRQVAIYFQKGDAAVLIHCGPDRGATCYASIRDRKRRATTDNASELPDGFLRSQLLQLVASG